MVDGPCKDLKPVPTVVWRDGGFAVVRTLEEGEQTYDIGLVRYGTEVEEEVIVEDTPAPEEEPSEE